MIFEGKVWKFGDNMNTDLMLPGNHTIELAARGMGTTPYEAARQICMRANRLGWAAQVQDGDIVIGGYNFGCGSARKAPGVFQVLGVSAILADSISRLFFRIAIYLGMPVLICEGVSQAFEEGDKAQVKIETGEVINLTKGTKIQGEALAADSPPMQILKAGGAISFIHQEMIGKQKKKVGLGKEIGN
ncbi:3-isopropylmalate dehydratase [Chloroflexota bacterium]